eukprot:5722560-Lingulodinium_polyedra.AAC.1
MDHRCQLWKDSSDPEHVYSSADHDVFEEPAVSLAEYLGMEAKVKAGADQPRALKLGLPRRPPQG